MIDETELRHRLDHYRGKQHWRTAFVFLLFIVCALLLPGILARLDQRLDDRDIAWTEDRRAYMAAQLGECRKAAPLETLHFYIEKRADGGTWQKTCLYARAPGYPARTVVLVEAAR